MHSNPHRVLFLCTANYYRSRFAELLFNHLAAARKLRWEAFSRALAVEENWCNAGPISPHTREACRTRGIPLPAALPHPRAAADQDFAAADRVIALKEAEHRKYVERRFGHFSKRVEYWHVHDLDGSDPLDACAQIERNVADLIDSLDPGLIPGRFS